MKPLKSLLFTAILLLSPACKKLVDVGSPVNQLTPDKVFSDSTSVVAATANMYTLFGTVDANFVKPVGTYTDELITTTASGVAPEFTNGTLSVTDASVLSVWQNLYATIYKANALIQGLQGSSGITVSLQHQSLGEAKFIRAYCHFMLANIYGDVPLILSTDVNINSVASRTPMSQVMAQVIKDLNDAVAILPVAYPFTGEKIHANKWAAAALLSKAYLFIGDNTNAEAQASAVINSGTYSLLSNLNSVYTINNNEAILQLWNATGFTTLNSVPASGVPPYQVSATLLAAFENNDQRKVNWVKSIIVSAKTYYYPYKYKQRLAVTGATAEYTMYLRYAEVYLLRAEARAKSNNTTGSAADLNVIRNRAGLPNTSAVTQADLLTAILHERQIELFNEGGNRFFDLKRTGKLDAVNIPLKPLWLTTASLFPVPQSEILSDPNLIQNPGY